MKLDAKTLLLTFAGLTSGLMLNGCAMFSGGDEDDALPPPPPARPTTVPVETDVSTPGGLAKEIFIEFPRRVGELASGKSAQDAAIAMQDSHPDRRRDAINNLVDRNYGKQAPYTDRYQQLAEFDADAGVRATALRALSRSRDASASKVFINGLDDDSGAVRLEAAKALANVPNEQAVPALIKMVNNTSESVDVRIAAADALRHYRSLEVARTLINGLNDRDFGVAWQSRQSLRYMTGSDQRFDQTAWLNYVTGPNKPLG